MYRNVNKQIINLRSGQVAIYLDQAERATLRALAELRRSSLRQTVRDTRAGRTSTPLRQL